MIGVIVIPGMIPGMHGLDKRRSSALLPLGDRPMLQHMVESLIAQKITEIELIVDHAPESIEALLGNGDRWGGRFRYHLVAQAEFPYRSLKVMSALKAQPWVLLHTEMYPSVSFPSPGTLPVVFLPSSNDASQEIAAAVFPPDTAVEALANLTASELYSYMKTIAAKDQAEILRVPDWIRSSTPEELLQSQTLLLGRKLDGLMISGTEREPGIWISRNVVVHPSVHLEAPVYIGPDTRINRGVRLGPNVVIEGECIVDSSTTIEHSTITSGSYIGEGLELDHAVVAHNLLINARLGTGVSISESFLLGGLKRRPTQSWILRVIRPVLALALFLVCLPVLLIALIIFALRGQSLKSINAVRLPLPEGETPLRTYGLLCIGQDAWSQQRRAGWESFTRQFLPGLLSVVRGKLGFVGLPPRTPEMIEALPEEWRQMYLAGSAGLITEVELAETDLADATQQYLAEAYYSVRRSFAHNLSLAGKYFLRLLGL